jgi:hypothetical protein
MLAKERGLEPTTNGFGDRGATITLLRHLVAEIGVEPTTLGL